MEGRSRRSAFRPVATRGSRRQAAIAENGARRHKPDYWIMILAALLTTIGLIVVYSISPALAASQGDSQNSFVIKQLIDVFLGVIAFAIASQIPSKTWRQLAKPLAIAAVVGSVIVMLTPINEIYQAHRWIRLGSFSFQIAELIKLALIVWTAGFLTDRWRRGLITDFNLTVKPLLIILAAIGLVVAKLQSDLGSAGVMLAILGAMAFTVGIPLKRIMLILGIVLVLVILAIASSSYRRERLDAFLHPQTSNCQGSGYQACQALISVGSGGLSGLGLGYSVQAYGYLPEPSNDSIFAIIAEKFGFIGSMITVVIYGVFIYRLKRLIEHTADQFDRLLAVGVLAWFSTQMIINVGAMLGLLPLKGITLPLISEGGTSLVFLAAALGIVFRLSRYTGYNVTEPSNHDTQNFNTKDRVNGWGVRRPHNPSLVARPRT